MNKLTYAEIKRLFTERNDKDNVKEPLVAVAVISQDSFSKPYSELERSYEFSSDNKAFKSWCGGYSIFANCLDGTDFGVRLEQYVEYGNWKVDYCYLK